MGHKIPVIFGINSTILTPEEIDLFQKNEVAGFILFSRNIESKQQLLELTRSLKSLYTEDVPIFVDQEGGRVARVKPPVIGKLYPSAQILANIYNSAPEQARANVEENYRNLMSDLKSLAIDSPCAPVCDIAYPETSDVIGDRAFGDNPEQVIDLCRSAILGIKQAGGIPFIKHVPGHGRATVDSHYELPVVDASLEELEATDFRVFRELAEDKDVWGMTAHIIYSCLDPTHTATTSPTVINYIREEIGFTGKLISDDLGMYALHGEVGKKRAILQRVVKLEQASKDWQTPFSEPLNDLFGINASQETDIVGFCQAQLEETKEDFLNNLARLSNETLEAGCDIVLHCSGDIDEMSAICQAI
jgi:beta-N-acetylhexosaminidase